MFNSSFWMGASVAAASAYVWQNKDNFTCETGALDSVKQGLKAEHLEAG